MRPALIPFILSALLLAAVPPAGGLAQGPAAQPFAVAGTDEAQVTAFLKCLQSSVALGNRLKVASLVNFPLKVWVEGEEMVIDNESEFQTYYGRIFDANVKKAISEAKVDTVSANPQGLTFDNGRVWFRPVTERKNALKIIAIGDQAQPR